MNMNNGDMPANPATYSKEFESAGAPLMPNGEKQKSYTEITTTGLTKREMMAMNADVSVELKSMDNFMDMAYFLGEDFNHQMTLESKISLKFRVAAKLKAMAADALLKELSK